MSDTNGAGTDDAEWLGVVLEKLSEDRQRGLPEPERLKALADDDARLDLVVGLLQGLTPTMLATSQWQGWFDGGASPRDVIDLVQFKSDRDSSKRKIQNAAGVYEKVSREVATARSGVAQARRSLEKAEAALADAEADQVKAAAKAQGAILWSILREVSKRADGIYAQSSDDPLLRTISLGLSRHEIEMVLREADEEQDIERMDVPRVLQAEKVKRILDALKELASDPKFADELRRSILQVCDAHLAKRSQPQQPGTLPSAAS